MPFVFNPSTGQDQVNPNRQQQPPAVGGANTGAQGNQQPQQKSQFSLPNSSVYLNESNAANLAYENAKQQLLTQRNSLYHQYGLTDSGAVDVNDPYGQYQTLLGNEGAALDQARNDSIGRGLGIGGLANQEEASLIPGQRAEQLDFQHQVDQTGQDYSSGLLDASNTHTSAINSAYQDALQDALARGLFEPSPSSSTSTTTTPSGSKTTKTTTPAIFRPNPKVTANKTGASARKRGGIYSIH